MKFSKHTFRTSNTKLAALVLAMGFGTGLVHAQTGGSGVSDQDRQFLKNTAQDSNFEIKTGQLALQKSTSSDVKQYATMLIRDHTQLKQQMKAVDTTEKLTDPSPTSMSIKDTATYTELKVLSGDSFDKAYIKELVKGNEEGLEEAKSEVSSSTVAPIKQLAQHRVALDTKHTEGAKQLAQAHHIQAQ